MNDIKISKIMISLFTAVLCFGPVGLADPVGTAFTYQGRLIDSNNAADGLYDFQFNLFDANNGGNKLGEDVNKPQVDVIDGYFTAELDFGGVFDGNNRWLEIGVRPGDQSDPCAYSLLSPRQKVTPTPYTLHARSVSAPLLLTAEAAPGTAVLSVASTGDGVAIGASSPNGYDIAVLGKDNTAVWGISPTGYAGYFDGKGYFSGNVGIGTADPVFKFQVEQGESKFGGRTVVANSSNYMLVEIKEMGSNAGIISLFKDGSQKVRFTADGDSFFNGGNVGIGTTSPAAKLEVAGQIKITGGAPEAGRVLTSDAAGLATWQIPVGGNSDWIIADNNMYSGVSGSVGIGTTSPAAKLDVVGDINAASVYRIGGNTVLSAAGTGNTLIGLDAGESTTGSYNTFSGVTAGYSNTTGHDNTFSGAWAGAANSTGNYNTFSGTWAGIDNTIGNYNTISGSFAGNQNTEGSYNTFSGYQAGYLNIEGNYNTYLGVDAGYYNNTGSYNTYSGAGAGKYCTTGSGNVFLGYQAGYNAAGSNKLYIANSDVNTIIYGDFSTGRVGISLTSPTEALDVSGTARLRGIGSSTGTTVVADATGKLWKQSSSQRYKQNIEPLDTEADAVLNLRPVRFEYKKSGHKDIGLIAEEVEKISPDLVIYDSQGRPDAVKYDKVALYLLSVVKSQQEEIAVLKDKISRNESLEQRVRAIESMMAKLSPQDKGGIK